MRTLRHRLALVVAVLVGLVAATSITDLHAQRVRINGVGSVTFGALTVTTLTAGAVNIAVPASATTPNLTFGSSAYGLGNNNGASGLGIFNTVNGLAFDFTNNGLVMFGPATSGLTSLSGGNSRLRFQQLSDSVSTTGGFQFGNANNATPVAQIVRFGENSRPGTDSNVGGASGTIQSGLGTGTGTASSLIFQTPVVAASGTTVQTQATQLTLSSASATFIPPVYLADGTAAVPGIAFASQHGQGLYTQGLHDLGFAVNGVAVGGVNDVNGWGFGGFGISGIQKILWASNHLLISATAPTISSGFGTSPSIAASNGAAAFTINVGTGGTAQNGVIGLPAATTGWIVQARDLTNDATIVVSQTASSTTTATIQAYSRTTGLAVAFNASDILQVTAVAF